VRAWTHGGRRVAEKAGRAPRRRVPVPGGGHQGRPAPGTSTWVASTRPVPGATISDMPRHSAATMNSVVPLGPRARRRSSRGPTRPSVAPCRPWRRARTVGWARRHTRRRLGRRGRCRPWCPRPTRPRPSVGQPTVRADVEGHQAVTVGVRDDQGGVVRGHRHPIRERDVVGHLAHRAVGCDQRHQARLERLPGHQVEAAAVDIGVAATVDHDVVPAWLAEVRVGDQGSVGFPAQQPPIRGRDDHQPAVREPGGTQRQRLHVRDHLAVAGEIDGDNLTRGSIREVQPVTVPARRLDQASTGEQGPYLVHPRHSPSRLLARRQHRHIYERPPHRLTRAAPACRNSAYSDAA
jgi:hypothetical protein